jgi:hypothetical protein
VIGRATIFQRMRTAGLLLALFALTFKAVLPPGYMLGAAAGERMAITLCGGVEARFDPRTGDIVHGSDQSGAPIDDKADAQLHCPFALVAAPVLAQPATTLAPPAHVSIFVPGVSRFSAPFFAAAGPPLPARGPPQHA